MYNTAIIIVMMMIVSDVWASDFVERLLDLSKQFWNPDHNHHDLCGIRLNCLFLKPRIAYRFRIVRPY
jgi:hypothetical protein